MYKVTIFIAKFNREAKRWERHEQFTDTGTIEQMSKVIDKAHKVFRDHGKREHEYEIQLSEV